MVYYFVFCWCFVVAQVENRLDGEDVTNCCVNVLGGPCRVEVRKQEEPEWKQRDELGVRKALVVDSITVGVEVRRRNWEVCFGRHHQVLLMP